MAAQRTLILRLEKANLIARQELQRADIAASWEEVSQPFQAIEQGVKSAVRHPWMFGGIAITTALALFVSGNFWLLRKTFKLATIAIPYLVRHRKSGLVGFILGWLKRRLLGSF